MRLFIILFTLTFFASCAKGVKQTNQEILDKQLAKIAEVAGSETTFDASERNGIPFTEEELAIVLDQANSVKNAMEPFRAERRIYEQKVSDAMDQLDVQFSMAKTERDSFIVSLNNPDLVGMDDHTRKSIMTGWKISESDLNIQRHDFIEKPSEIGN